LTKYQITQDIKFSLQIVGGTQRTMLYAMLMHGAGLLSAWSTRAARAHQYLSASSRVPSPANPNYVRVKLSKVCASPRHNVSFVGSGGFYSIFQNTDGNRLHSTVRPVVVNLPENPMAWSSHAVLGFPRFNRKKIQYAY
jgi:hypothetical protein